MEKTLQVLNDLEEDGVVARYALGGATALLFYTEPALTYDLDVFIFFPEQEGARNQRVVDLAPLYRVLRQKGYQPEKEHVMIEGIPVQFIPAYNPLVEEGIREAVEKEYQGVKTRVVRLEHLLAIMLDTGRAKDRERIRELLEEVELDKKGLSEILDRHRLRGKWEALVGKN